jgi:hypothetical protein
MVALRRLPFVAGSAKSGADDQGAQYQLPNYLIR